MRCVLLGGLAVALWVGIGPASAQVPTPADTDPMKRAAGLGRPVALPDTQTGEEVTPAGLLSRSQAPVAAPAIVYPPPGATYPVALSGIPTPVLAAPPAGASLLPPPRTLGSPPPTVTELRDVPPSGTTMPSGGTIVPSIGPSGLGEVCPQPCLDDATYGGAYPGGVPRFPALGRLFAATWNNSYWVSGEYLLWWTQAARVPVLATTSSPQFFGIPGNGNTQPIIGGSFGETLHGGARFSAGYWFNESQCRGIDARFMFLFRNGTEQTVTTAAFPLLARPFFNANVPFGPFSEVVGAPGLATGNLAVTYTSSLWGADVNYRRFLGGSPCSRLDGLLGFRYLNLTEDLAINETFIRTPGSDLTVGVPASMGGITDQFRTENNFYGGQIGLTGEVRRGRWFVDGRATVALGTVHQTVQIAGAQTLLFPSGQVQHVAGGLLALPGANIGTFSQNKFAVLPEVGVNVGYHITQNLRVFVGYNFLYLSSVVRPGDAIDPVLDAARIPNFPLPGSPAPLPGFARPSPLGRTTDFWAQGINFGIQFTW